MDSDEIYKVKIEETEIHESQATETIFEHLRDELKEITQRKLKLCNKGDEEN